MEIHKFTYGFLRLKTNANNWNVGQLENWKRSLCVSLFVYRRPTGQVPGGAAIRVKVRASSSCSNRVEWQKAAEPLKKKTLKTRVFSANNATRFAPEIITEHSAKNSSPLTLEQAAAARHTVTHPTANVPRNYDNVICIMEMSKVQMNFFFFSFFFGTCPTRASSSSAYSHTR